MTNDSRLPTPDSRLNVVVAMPAYNEEKYIGTMVLAAKQYAGWQL